MYDCIKLEAGDLVTGIDEVTGSPALSVKSAKYIHNGRLVIEKGGQRFTVDGRRM